MSSYLCCRTFKGPKGRVQVTVYNLPAEHAGPEFAGRAGMVEKVTVRWLHRDAPRYRAFRRYGSFVYAGVDKAAAARLASEWSGADVHECDFPQRKKRRRS